MTTKDELIEKALELAGQREWNSFDVAIASDLLKRLATRLQKAEKVCESLGPALWQHHEAYQAWRAARDGESK